jgi:hypothetical protein
LIYSKYLRELSIKKNKISKIQTTLSSNGHQIKSSRIFFAKKKTIDFYSVCFKKIMMELEMEFQKKIFEK